MACVICEDDGYEGQYVQGLGGTVCLSCLEVHDEKLKSLRMLSQRLSMTVSHSVYKTLSRDYAYLKKQITESSRSSS